MPDNVRNETGLRKLRKYLDKPRTMAEVLLRMSIEKRTAYRWFKYLREDGHDIVTRRGAEGYATYQVQQ